MPGGHPALSGQFWDKCVSGYRWEEQAWASGRLPSCWERKGREGWAGGFCRQGSRSLHVVVSVLGVRPGQEEKEVLQHPCPQRSPLSIGREHTDMVGGGLERTLPAVAA